MNQSNSIPQVTGVSPSTGSISGTGKQQLVTITGTNFTGANSVFFDGVPSPGFSVSLDGTTITATAPQHAPGEIDVQVSTPSGGQSATNANDKYTYEYKVTSVSPSSGPLVGSDNSQNVKVSGLGFANATQVLFGGIPVSLPHFTINSDEQITTSVPPGAQTGQVDIQVSTNLGLTPKNPPADQYNYESQPAIISLGTSSGPNTGGTTVVINGSGFTGVTNVMFGSNAATIQPGGTDVTVTVISPAGSGTVDVTVITPNGTSPIIAGDQFMYSTIPFSFTIPDDVAEMGVYLSMYGFLQQPYKTIPANTNVILINTGTEYDYIEASGVPSGQMIPPFLCVNEATTAISINIPNVNIKAARIVIGINSDSPVALTSVSQASNNQQLPQGTINVDSIEGFSNAGALFICTNSGITQVNYTGTDTTNNSFTGCTGGTGTILLGTIISSMPMVTPEVNDAVGDISAPTPSSQGENIYDFFEFTYLPVAGLQTMTINTSAIDQFGLPIQLNVSGQSVQPGNNVGVTLKRDDVITQFSNFPKNTAYNELIYPSAAANPVIRILSPSDQLGNNPVQGLTVSNTTTTPGQLVQGTIYSYVVAAIINQIEIPAPVLLAQTTPSSTGSVTISWAQGVTGTTYNIYRGVPNGNNVTWYLIGNEAGATYTDSGPGTSGTAQSPVFDPLGNYFDTAIQNLFNSTNPIILTVTDGSLPANGLQYTFSGITKSAPSWINQATGTTGNQVIEFSCIGVTNNPTGIRPLIPIGSLFYVFSPFFNTNTINPSNPKPPVWNGNQMLFSNLFPTDMAFGADGIFADNVQQSAALYASLTTTTIASGSDKSVLPQTSIQVASTAGFQTLGVLYISELNTLISYTGISANSFTGCSGGAGTLSEGMHIYGPLQLATVSGAQTLPSPTINSSGTTGYPTNGGTLYIWTPGAASSIPVTYTGISDNSFTGCSGGTGPLPDGSLIAVNNCQPIGFATVSGSQKLPATTINASSTAGYPANGGTLCIWAPGAAIPIPVIYTGITGNSFTGCSGGAGSLPDGSLIVINNCPPFNLATTSGVQTLPSPAINVSDTTGYPANGGTLYIWTPGSTTPIPVTYTGVNGNSFTGCSGGTGPLPDGSLITINNCPTIGLDQNAYSVAIGSLEDALDAAILRGVASTMNSVNWANAPTTPSAGAGPSTTTNTSTYYYVITTVNSSGESTPSEEISYTTNNTSIQLSWAPVNGASSYNIYRGTSAGGENILIGNAASTSFEDKLSVATLTQASPPESGNTSAPGNLTATAVNLQGNLAAGTYYYVVTALGYNGESPASNEVNVQVVSGSNAVTLTWNSVANASAYKIYRGTAAGQENILAGILQGGNNTCSFTDGNNATQTPPPNIYYAPGTTSDAYAQFFHLANVSTGGLAYADPYDDQGGQSSTLTAVSPYAVNVTLESWTDS